MSRASRHHDTQGWEGSLCLPVSSFETGATAARTGMKVIVTAWPSRTVGDLTLFRSRVWDAHADSAPFYVWADRHLLSSGLVVALATLAAADETTFDILEGAAMRHGAVEFNQAEVSQADLCQALVLSGTELTVGASGLTAPGFIYAAVGAH
jgi:hypothetical protein